MVILRELLGPSKRTASASNQDRRIESKRPSLCVCGEIVESQWNTRGHGPRAGRWPAVRQISAIPNNNGDIYIHTTCGKESICKSQGKPGQAQLCPGLENTEHRARRPRWLHLQKEKSLLEGHGDVQGSPGGFSWSVQSSSTKTLEKLKGSVWNANRTKDRKALTWETGSSLKWIIKKSQWEKIY